MLKSFDQLRLLPTLLERYEYLKQNIKIGVQSFGVVRYLYQMFYNLPVWQVV